ncbi:hypothetical protein [Criblamydia sequanensis]|uniref:Conserved putative secreted protein n=1 Tax=Candidatus Criblamydia sequanensis CRIB-18 TaxID=1437425 RepID=A0A090D1J1_9BACT|nr:hypothetical protein [Criblamydia sequanensis]CDR33855.1 Conserved putative secreted protein [Criblamydia sequanensis CRIB-18]
MPLILIVLVLALTSCSQSNEPKSHGKVEQTVEDAPLFKRALNLPKTGILKMKRDGYLYVKVDDRYIHNLQPKIRLQGFKKPPYFRESDSPGAHISVAYTFERVAFKGYMPELNQEISFTPVRLETVRKGNGTEYFLLVVQSKQLEEIRKRHGLKPKLMDHDFHITIGVKRPKRVRPKMPYPRWRQEKQPIRILAPAPMHL